MPDRPNTDAESDAEPDVKAETDPEADTETVARRRRLVEAIVEARKAGNPVEFEAVTGTERGVVRIEYEDRAFRLEIGDDERERLEALLDDYHVFKFEQPATRMAPDGVVHLSAVTDPKHAADFVEALFEEVYCADERYELRVRDQ